MKSSVCRLANRSTMFATPLLAAAVIAASTNLSMTTTDRIRQATLDYIPTAVIDTSSTTVGVSDSDLYGMTPDKVNEALDKMKSMGITTVRVLVPWAGIEPLNGVYNWTEVDKVVNAAYAKGMGVLGVLTSSPWWSNSAGILNPNGAPLSNADFADFAKTVADRYGAAKNNGNPKISAYEVWNEPNGLLGWMPSIDPSGYTALLKAAYTAIKSVDTSITVVGGVVGSVSTMGGFTMNPVKFVEQMYANGASGFFDAISFHPYQYTMEFSDGKNYGSSVFDEGYASSPIDQLLAIRAMMDAKGDSTKLIWATEYGVPTNLATPEQQAAFIKDFLDTWSTLTGVGPAFLYSTFDRLTGSNDVEDNFGLFNSDGTPKDVVAVLTKWIEDHLQPPTTTPGTPATPSNPLQALVDQITSYFAQVTAQFQSMVAGFQKAWNDAFAGFQAAMQNVVKAFQNFLSGFTGQTVVAAAQLSAAAAPEESADTATASAKLAKALVATPETATTEAAPVEAAADTTAVDAAAVQTAPVEAVSTEVTPVESVSVEVPATETETPATPVSETDSSAPATDDTTTGTDEDSSTPAEDTSTKTDSDTDTDSSSSADDKDTESSDSTDSEDTKSSTSTSTTSTSSSSSSSDDDSTSSASVSVTKKTDTSDTGSIGKKQSSDATDSGSANGGGSSSGGGANSGAEQ